MFITRAAIMYSNGEVMEGHDYGDISSLAKKLSLSSPDNIEGFITSSGEFVLPIEAATIAVNANQVPEVLDRLTPEHLWPEGMTE